MPVKPSNSRRSSTTTRTSPKWLTSSTSKRHAATTVSLVFAQPEQAPPLGSAAEKLPIVMVDDAASLSSYSSGAELGQRASFESIVAGETSGRSVSTMDIGVDQVREEVQHKEEGQVAEDVAENVKDSRPLAESPINNVPAPEILCPAAASTESTLVKPESLNQSSLPQNNSWFGSFTRSRGRNAISKPQSSTLPQVEIFPTDSRAADTIKPLASFTTEDATPPSSDIPTIHILPTSPPRNTAGNEESPSLSAVASSTAEPITILHEPKPSRSWFSSASYSPPQKESAASGAHNSRPQHSHLTSNATSISSVDDEVPRPMSTPVEVSAITSIPVTPQLQKERIRTSSLTASSSLFTLRIPLLGRPKMPLDQVVAVAHAEDNGKVPSDNSDFHIQSPLIPAESEQLEQAQTSAFITTDSEAEAAQIEQNSEGFGETKVDGVTTASSWWDYVRWDSSTSLNSAPPAVGSRTTIDLADETSHITDAAAPAQSGQSLPTAQSSPPTHVIAPDLRQSDGDPMDTQDLMSSGQTPSLPSAETNKSLNYAWYSSWLRYSGSGTTEPPTDEASGSIQVESSQAKTESELIQQEALARETPAPTSDESKPSEQQTSLPKSFDLTNPIQSTLVDNKSSWASFFLSRSVKSITQTGEQKEDSGMEVMDIDEDEDTNVASASGSIKSGKAQGQDLQHSLSKPSPTKPAKNPSKDQEPEKKEPPAPPLTNSETLKHQTPKGTTVRQASPSPSAGRSGASTPISPRSTPPNLVLPTWGDTFRAPPRSVLPPLESSSSTIAKTFRFVSGLLSSGEGSSTSTLKGKARARDFVHFGKELPRALDVVGDKIDPVLLNGECKVAVIGIAGWSPSAVTRTIAGGLPSSSSKFVTMTCQALERFEEIHGVKFKKVTKIALEGDGTVARKVDKVHQHLVANPDWMDDLHAADVIFVAAHSQGSIVAAHLIDRLIREGHIRTSSVAERSDEASAADFGTTSSSMPPRRQKICCLCLCGIHLGPLRYLKLSSFIQPYIQYFENAAAREIFEFQNTDNPVSRDYVSALRNVMRHGTKIVYVASLNDQMVPIYSGLFTAATHPHILRALYIDGDAYHSSDFLSNLLVLLLRILNSGLSDSGLLTHLSEATAGSLSGVGHSSAYEEPAVFSLAVNYQFLVNDGDGERHELVVEPFNAVTEQNDYEIPWSLRDLIANERVAHLFSREFVSLRDAFGDWQPKTTILRDVKRKLQPIQRLSSISTSPSGPNFNVPFSPLAASSASTSST